MKILFLSHYYAPEGNAPATRAYENCSRWAAAGHEVTVITCAPNVPTGIVYPGYSNRLSQTELIDGVRVIRVWTWLAANKGSLRRIANYLSFMVSATIRACFVRAPDLVLATSPQFFNGWAGVFASRLRRRPFVLEIRDIWPESITAVGAMKEGMAVRALGHLERWLYQAADHIVTVGNGYRHKLEERGVPPDKIAVIPNGANLDRFQPGPRDPEIIRRYGLEGKFVVAYVGTIGMACGLRSVLQAADQLKKEGNENVVFLLAGDGAQREALEDEAFERALYDTVRFTGRVDKSEIPALLASMDVALVHLSKKKLFETVLPSKIFEAFATGKPILVAVPGAATELVLEAGGGVAVEPENPAALLTSIESLRRDPERCQRLGMNGHRYVEKHYDRDDLASRYLRLLEEMPHR